MNFLEERILEDARVIGDEILLVDSFINQQVDLTLMQMAGDTFAEHFKQFGITRVLTVESSGIVPAAMTAMALQVPLVVAKKAASKITSAQVYHTEVQSFTKGKKYEMTVAEKFLPAGENILLIDDFLAMGEAALGVGRIIREANCTLAGIGILIEKSFQPGRQKLKDAGYHVFSLARIASMSDGEIRFLEEDGE